MNVQAIAEIPISVRRWKAYRSYKDSGVKWLGSIPEHWEVKRVKFLASFHGGGTPSKANLDYWIGDIPWISPKDMKNETVNDSEDHITEEALATSATQLVRPGAVLIVVRSGILKHSIPVAINMRPVALNQDMKAMVPRSVLSPDYLKYLIVGHQDALLVEWRKAGATVESIEHELLVNSCFPVPSLPEQLSIVGLLDRETAKIDALVAHKEQLIALLQEKRAALISRAVTKGLDPNVPMKASGIEWLRELPAHWEIQRLKRLCSIAYGLSLELDRTAVEGTRIISLPNVSLEGDLDLAETALSPVSEEEKKALLLKNGDLLFNWRNGSSEHVGKTALFEQEGEFIHVSFLLRLRFDQNKHASRYFQRYLNSLRYTGFFSSTKAGVNNTFNQSELQSLEVPVPPLTEQNAIADFLASETQEIDDLIPKVREGIEKLKEYRTALISAAVTGKIDVREENSPQSDGRLPEGRSLCTN